MMAKLYSWAMDHGLTTEPIVRMKPAVIVLDNMQRRDRLGELN